MKKSATESHCSCSMAIPLAEKCLHQSCQCFHKEFEKVDVIGSSGGAIAAINMALENPDMVNTIVADSFEGLSANSDITDRQCKR